MQLKNSIKVAIIVKKFYYGAAPCLHFNEIGNKVN